MRNRQPDFSKENIAAGGAIHQALTEGRVLHTRVRDETYVIAHINDRDRAFALAAEISGDHRGTDAYTILLDDNDLAAVAARTDRRDVTVYDAQRGHKPARKKIKVNGWGQIKLSTEYGPLEVSAALVSDLRAGDVFTSGIYTTFGDGNENGLTVYRVVNDPDPVTGTFDRHIITRTWDTAHPADRANLTLTSEWGKDRIVHRAVNRAAFLADVRLSDYAPAR